MKKKEYSRRKFIHRFVAGSAAVIGVGVLINSCQGNNKPETKDSNTNAPSSTNPCSDFSGVSAEELEKRRKFGYVDKSVVDGNTCGNCGLYLPWEKEKTCGGCLLFKGPVYAEGHCMQWVAKTQT